MRSSQKFHQKLEQSITLLQRKSIKSKNSHQALEITNQIHKNGKLDKSPKNKIQKNIILEKNVDRMIPVDYHLLKGNQFHSENYIQSRKVSQPDYKTQSKYIENGDNQPVFRKGSPGHEMPNQQKKYKCQHIQPTPIRNQQEENTIKRTSPYSKNPLSNYLIKPQLVPKRRQSPNIQNIQKPSQNNYVIPISSFVDLHEQQLCTNNESLYQLVENLQTHNKNIMQQAKKTVENFQNYIKELLTSSSAMETKLTQYEQRIQKLQKQKIQYQEREKVRDIKLGKSIKQKISVYKQLKTQRQNKVQLPTTSNVKMPDIQLQAKKKQQQIQSLKFQLSKKQQNILLLQQLISQKQTVIKNMANFHNEMCEQVMKLKNKRSYTLDSTKENTYNDDKQEQKNNIAMMKMLENKLLDSGQQNCYLKKLNQQIRKQIQQLIRNNQVYLSTIQKQQKTIQNLKNIIQKQMNKVKFGKYCNNYMENSKKSEKSSSIDLKKIKSQDIQQNYKKIINKKNEKKKNQLQNQDNFRNSQLEIQSDNLQKQLVNLMTINQFKIPNDAQQNQDGILLKKIDNILQILCVKLKNDGYNKKNRTLIYNIMKTLTKFNNLVIQGQIQYENKLNKSYSIEDGSFLCKLEGFSLQNKQSNHQIQYHMNNNANISSNVNINNNNYNSSTLGNIVQRNQQILKKLKQIKQKVKTHTKNISPQNVIIQQINSINQNPKINQIERLNLKDLQFTLGNKNFFNAQSCHLFHDNNRYHTNQKY